MKNKGCDTISSTSNLKKYTRMITMGILISLIVGAVSLFTYSSSEVDTWWNVPVGISIIKEGNIDLNEFSDLITERDHKGIENINNHYYNHWVIGGSLIPLPFIYIGNLLQPGNFQFIESFSSKLLFIFCVFSFYCLCWFISKNIYVSAFLSLIFAFATPNLYILSGGLWTHGDAELMIIFTLITLVIGKKLENDWISSLSIVFLFLGYTARPTIAIFIPFVLIYLYFTKRRVTLYFIILGIACMLIYVFWSLSTFNTLLPPYFSIYQLSLDTFFVQLTGLLFSPNRGLFIYVPLVFFSFAGMYMAIKDSKTDLIFKLLPLVILCYFVVFGSFFYWWGGYSYGPRLFTDLMPIFVIYLYWVVTYLQKGENKLWLVLFIIVLVYCVTVQALAVIDPNYSVYAWNSVPYDVDTHPERVWDWTDMQILRFFNL